MDDSSLPDFANGELIAPDPNNITVQLLAHLIRAAAITLAAIAGLVYVFISFGWGWELTSALIAAAVLIVLALVTAFIWPRVDHQHTRFRIDRLGIEILTGVIWRHRICVPIGRVQHADVAQGPLQRTTGVASLVLHTAGTSNASVSVDGLSHSLAIEVRDWIVHQRQHQDAV